MAMHIGKVAVVSNLQVLSRRTDDLERHVEANATVSRQRHDFVLAELRLLRMWVLGLVINSLLLFVCVLLLAGEVL